jgi:predicted secreted protein
MGWISGIVVYFLIWWVALFAVLPIGTRPEPASDPGSGWRGTPERPQLWRKVVITTAVTTVLWFGVYLLIDSEWLSFRTGWLAMPEK